MSNRWLKNLSLMLALAGGIGSTGWVNAEDIDVFVKSSGGGAPNVLIILDNSSNWAANNQNWPPYGEPSLCGSDCDKQGMYELIAIRNVIKKLTECKKETQPDGTPKWVAPAPFNLGLMLFNNSNADRDGGYIRYHMRPMVDTAAVCPQVEGASVASSNLAAFLAQINEIISHFNTETAASSVQYGSALFDAFKYFGGLTNPDNAHTNAAPGTNPEFHDVHIFGTEYWGSRNADAGKPDQAAYTGDEYNPPQMSACGRNHIIFVGNGFPAKDNLSNGSVNDMGWVFKRLTNPAAPPASIDEIDITTNTPVYTSASCSQVNFGPGNACTDEADCLIALEDSSYPKLAPPATGFSYFCRGTGCNGNKQRVHKCNVTGWTSVSGEPSANAADRLGDEFADFLYRTDVSSEATQQYVNTHAINVYRARPSQDQEALMRSMAVQGGGKYFAASNLAAIELGFLQIFREINAVNTVFASASLPVNATNRAQSENQVFIGMFRPAQDFKPRWLGNLKRYQLKGFDGQIKLADLLEKEAVNKSTGFVDDCATSWWTTSSDSLVEASKLGWWEDYPSDISMRSICPEAADKPYSDAPDGPTVEKGAVAEVIRKGNKPPDSNDTPTWSVERTIKTLSGSSLVDFTAASSGLADPLVQFIKGHDINNEDVDETPANTSETRASLHGGVIHSRPLPINYADGGIKIYYGANDGTLRVVDADTGKEDWAFIAPESFSKLLRLKDNSPDVKYGFSSSSGALPMDYFFDGSPGIYQNLDNDKIWIYPTMRRGGNAIYAFNVTDPAAPTFKWKVDPSVTGFDKLGQTWSRPNVAWIAGYPSMPVLIVGGGHDPCEDVDTATPATATDGCDTPAGARVYIIDADTGTLVKSFATERSVVADISLVDVDNDAKVDYAYAADLGGNIFRISFIDPTTRAPLASSAWTMSKVAYTNGDHRKFFFGPAVLPVRQAAVGGEKDLIYLAIGSGDREHPLISDYPYAGVTNRFYVLLDDPKEVPATVPALDLDDPSKMLNKTSDTAGCASAKILPETASRGWFMDLNQYGLGEQTVTSALVVGGMVTFSTNRPTPSAMECGNTMGEARGYWVNLLNASGAIGVTGTCGGTRSGTFEGGGLPPSPVVANVPVEIAPGKTEVVTVVIGAVQKEGGASSGIEGQRVEPDVSSTRHRKYWYINADE